MTARLRRTASGPKHLRWGREVLATMAAHVEHNDQLTTPQKKLLQTEQKTARKLVDDLDKAVTPYREFLDNARVEIRAKQRVANFLCDIAQQTADGQLRPHRATIDGKIEGGFARIFSKQPLSRVLRAGHKRTAEFAVHAAESIRLLPASVPARDELADRLEKVGTMLGDLVRYDEQHIEPKRRPLKLSVERAVLELREGLEKMDARLREQFAPEFIESLYPELDSTGTAVADEDHEDDDTAGEPVAPAAAAGAGGR